MTDDKEKVKGTVLKEILGPAKKETAELVVIETQTKVRILPPCSLGSTAKREFKRLGAILAEQGLYTELDRPALAIYCNAYAMWVKANNMLNKRSEKVVKDGPNGGDYLSNWYHVMNKAEDKMAKYMALFGMSPADRVKLKSDGTTLSDPKKPKNPFDYI